MELHATMSGRAHTSHMPISLTSNIVDMRLRRTPNTILTSREMVRGDGT